MRPLRAVYPDDNLGRDDDRLIDRTPRPNAYQSCIESVKRAASSSAPVGRGASFVTRC